VDLFEQQWSIYRRVVEADLMEHTALTAATAAALRRWLKVRRAGARLPVCIDLGCGDLALLPPLLRQLPLGTYHGLDLSASVLELAARAVATAPFPCHWQERNALEWAVSDPADQQMDLIHSAFALHHLDDEDKVLFLSQARRHLAPGGMFLWADVFRLPGERRDDYLTRYGRRIRDNWHPLSAEERETVIQHLQGFDHPADAGRIETTARQCGWTMEWFWRGHHRAEALAVLTPASMD
jgi:SAM-dependent methyltransferase